MKGYTDVRPGNEDNKFLNGDFEEPLDGPTIAVRFFMLLSITQAASEN